MYCRLDTDNWEDAGVVYFVHRYARNEPSTATELTLESPEGIITERVVAYHQIEWIDNENTHRSLFE
jgi:hypothetical protein